jgi:hypothetical protein
MSNSRVTKRAIAPRMPTSRAVRVSGMKDTRARTPQPAAWAPAGYDETDIGILEWIASHRRGRTTQRAPLAG